MPCLTVDYGSSSCRASSVDDDGNILGESRIATGLTADAAGSAELDPEAVWDRVRQVIRTEAAAMRVPRYDAVGISSILGWVLSGRGGDDPGPGGIGPGARLRTLGGAPTWLDSRAAPYCAELLRNPGLEWIHARTGRRPAPDLLGPFLMHLRQHEPDRHRRIIRVHGLKDHLVLRLTGSFVTDFTHRDYSLLFRVGSGEPIPELLDRAGVGPGILPAALPAHAVAGAVTRTASAETGLPEGTPVIAGATDGTTAMYGCGVLLPGTQALVTGTSDVLMQATARFPADDRCRLSINTAMEGGGFLAGGATGTAGGMLVYLCELFGSSREEAVAAAGTVPPGADGLLAFPGMPRERAPFWGDRLTGGFLGLGPWHGREHFFRAAMEGTAYRIRRLREAMAEAGLSGAEALRITGGGAAIPLWNRIRADVLEQPLLQQAEHEATTLGTALFCRAAATGAGLREVSGAWCRTSRRWDPEGTGSEAYRENYRRFLEHMETI